MSLYRYNCGGFASYDGPCGASDCGSCRNGPAPWEEEEEEACESSDYSSYRISSRDRAGINAGDLYVRVSGFEFIRGGRRTQYWANNTLVARGPSHPKHDPAVWADRMAARERQLAKRRVRRVRRA